MTYAAIRRLLAEFVGTFALVFIGAGSVLASQASGFGQGGAGLIVIALAHGLAIGTMVSAVGHISGGHFNPAITVAAWTTRRITTRYALLYVATQLLGGAAGALTLRLVLPEALWRPLRVGLPGVAGGISDGQAVTIEGVLTFFLVWVVFATALDPDGSFNKIAGLAIGFAIAMDIMMGGPFTGAAMNPARSFGPALASGTWAGHWLYWVGPVAGAVLAGGAYELIIIRRRPAA